MIQQTCVDLFCEVSACLTRLHHTHVGLSCEQRPCASLLKSDFIDCGMSDSELSSEIKLLEALHIAQISVL